MRYKASNSSDLEVDLSRPLKVICDGVIGLAIYMYGFLLMVNTNIGPNLAPLRDVKVCNQGHLNFGLSKSLKVKSNGAVGLPIMHSY